MFYGYFSNSIDFHKTAVRFGEYELAHDESIGFGDVIVTIVIVLLTWLVSSQLFLLFARRMRLRSRRLLVQAYQELRKHDARPPIIFLRPFKDDQISLHSAPLRWFMRFFDPGVKAATLDEMLVQNFSDLGPVLAIGNPEDAVPPIGSVRLYTDDAEWQQVVESLMASSVRIVVAVADARNLWWEIERITRHRYLGKTIIVIPPSSTEEMVLLEKLLSMTSPAAISDLEAEMQRSETVRIGGREENNHLIAMAFDESGEPTFFTSNGLSELEYDVALRLGIQLGEHSSNVSG